MNKVQRFWRRFCLSISNPSLAIRRVFFGAARFSLIDTDEISPFLSSEGIIVEAGAADGVDTVNFLKKFPFHKVYALEPVIEQFALLHSTFGENPRVHLSNLALADREGIAKIFVGRDGNEGVSGMGSSSLLRPTGHLDYFKNITFSEEQSVETISLQQFAKQNGITSIDLLWLDLQGLEYRVIEASAEFVSNSVSVLHTESSRVNLYEGGKTQRQLHSLLVSLGFKIVLNRIGVISGNALYVNQRLKI